MIRDYAFYAAQRERAVRRASQDAILDARHAAFDRSAQDRHSKSERPHFAVVTASAAFRQGWDRLFGRPEHG